MWLKNKFHRSNSQSMHACECEKKEFVFERERKNKEMRVANSPSFIRSLNWRVRLQVSARPTVQCLTSHLPLALARNHWQNELNKIKTIKNSAFYDQEHLVWLSWCWILLFAVSWDRSWWQPFPTVGGELLERDAKHSRQFADDASDSIIDDRRGTKKKTLLFFFLMASCVIFFVLV